MTKTAETRLSDDRRKETKTSANVHFSWTVLASGTSSGIERWESCASRNEKKLKDKLDDEIKLAGLEALVLEELEKHLILNANRLRTFENARLEFATYVEAKFGSRIRDSKTSDTGTRGHSFNETAMHAKAPASNRMANANRASHGPRVSPHIQAKVRVRKTRETPEENPKESKVRTKMPKTHTRADRRKLVSQILRTRKWMQAQTFRNLH